MELLAQASEGVEPDRRPKMHTWSPEVEAITRVGDMVKALVAITIMANSKPGAKKPDSAPELRPGTVLTEVRRQHKRQRHAELVKRVLPDD